MKKMFTGFLFSGIFPTSNGVMMMETHSFYFFIGDDVASRQDFQGSYEACMIMADRFLSFSTYDYYVHMDQYKFSLYGAIYA